MYDRERHATLGAFGEYTTPSWRANIVIFVDGCEDDGGLDFGEFDSSRVVLHARSHDPGCRRSPPGHLRGHRRHCERSAETRIPVTLVVNPDDTIKGHDTDEILNKSGEC